MNKKLSRLSYTLLILALTLTACAQKNGTEQVSDSLSAARTALLSQCSDMGEEYIDSFVRSHYNDVLGPFVLAVYCGGMNYGMLNSKIQSLINDAPESFRNNRFVESLRMPMNDK